MDCAAFARVLHPFLDGELDLESTLAATAHIASCPDCAARVAHFRALGQAVRQAVTTELPGSLRERVAALTAPPPARPRRLRLALAGVVAVAALVAVALFLLLRQPGLDEDDVREVVALHIRSQLPGHLIDLDSADRARIAPWFAKQLTFTPWVGDLSDHGYALRGARMDYCDGQRVAVLVFQQGEHVINLVSYPAEDARDQPALTIGRDGMNLCGWSSHGLQFFVISDLPQDALARFPGWVRL
jgi:anti-sigma factor RsiW